MDRKKKKQQANKTAANVEQQRKALKDRFLERITNLITLIGGDELLQKFPPIFLDQLFTCRYPVLKGKAAPGMDINKSRVVQFNKLLHTLIHDIQLDLHNGKKVPISWILSDGLTLIDCVGELDPQHDPRLLDVNGICLKNISRLIMRQPVSFYPVGIIRKVNLHAVINTTLKPHVFFLLKPVQQRIITKQIIIHKT